MPESRYSDVLNVVHELESSSGRNPAAYKENAYGALGEYQMRRSTFEQDLKRAFPKKWGRLKFEDAMQNPTLAREAAGDYMKLIRNYLTSKGAATTDENLLASYHSGMGRVARGGALGPAGMEYLKRARMLREGGK